MPTSTQITQSTQPCQFGEPELVQIFTSQQNHMRWLATRAGRAHVHWDQEIEDILQDSLLRAWQARSQYDGRNQASPMSWVGRIIRNVTLDRRRRQTAQDNAAITVELPEDELPGRDKSVLTEMLEEEALDRLRFAISRLTPPLRRALEQSLRGEPFPKVQRHRAIQALRKRMTGGGL